MIRLDTIVSVANRLKLFWGNHHLCFKTFILFESYKFDSGWSNIRIYIISSAYFNPYKDAEKSVESALFNPRGEYGR